MWHKLKAVEITKDKKEKGVNTYSFKLEGEMPLLYEDVFLTYGKGCMIFADKLVETKYGINFENERIRPGDTIYWCKLRGEN